MAALIYSLCALTAFLCSWLLFAAWRRSRYRLLLWGALCFAGLTFGNLVLIVDKIFLPVEIDLSVWRYGITLVALLILLYGLIFDTE
ncbi:DUF5985 family protein [Asticcacaulis solisilvae]|uniref:DUF5985 family protein n=1 Tax=Asticcacaulis solisilvae TaxID=1217274 RepID=UPI003FD76ECE